MITKAKERTAERLLRNLPKKRTIIGYTLYGELGRIRFLTGTKSMHRTSAARKCRLLWRLNND